MDQNLPNFVTLGKFFNISEFLPLALENKHEINKREDCISEVFFKPVMLDAIIRSYVQGPVFSTMQVN